MMATVNTNFVLIIILVLVGGRRKVMVQAGTTRALLVLR